MKKLFAFILSILLLSSVVLAVGDISLTDIVQPSAVKPTQVATGSFKVSSQSNLNVVVFVKNDLLLAGNPSKKIDAGAINFNPGSLSNVGSTPQQVSFTINVPEFTVPGTYQGAVEVTDTGANHDTFNIVLNILSDPKFDLVGASETTPLRVSAQEEETKTTTFQVKNTGNVVLNSLVISGFSFTDNDGEVANVAFSNIPSNVQPNAFGTITTSVTVPRNFDLGKYTKNVSVSDSALGITKNFVYELTIQPEICEVGVVSDGVAGGNNLDITVDKPDSGDDFNPGDVINIEVDVKNNDNDDLDVIVEAILYNIDKAEEVETAESDSASIRDGRTESFDFELEVPSDDIDEDDSYVLFIKASEEDDEDKNCNEESVTVDFELEDHMVVVDEVTFVPSTVACSESFDAVVDVVNVGAKDQDDIFVRLVQSALRVDLTSERFDLDKASDSDNDQTIRFNDVLVPANAEAKSYQFEAIVTFRDGDKTSSKFTNLVVQSCTGTPNNGGVNVGGNSGSTSGQASISLPTPRFTVRSGDAVSLPVIVSNTGSGSQTYTLEVTNVEGFAQSVPSKSLSLQSGESSTVYFVLNTKSDLNSAVNSGTVNVKSGNNVLATNVFNVEVQGGSSITGGFLGGFGDTLGDSRVFWIIGDIVLVILAIFFIKLIFTSGRKKQ